MAKWLDLYSRRMSLALKSCPSMSARSRRRDQPLRAMGCAGRLPDLLRISHHPVGDQRATVVGPRLDLQGRVPDPVRFLQGPGAFQ